MVLPAARNEHKTYAYDSWLNLTDVSSISQGQTYTTHYTYDNPTNFYDRVGEVTSITEAYGLTGIERTTNYTYNHRTADPFLLTRQHRDKNKCGKPRAEQDHHHRLRYRGNVLSRTETGYVVINGSAVQSYTTQYQYNAQGQITQINGPRDVKYHHLRLLLQ